MLDKIFTEVVAKSLGVIAALAVGPAVTVLAQWVRNKWKYSKSGIRRVYNRGRDIKGLNRAITRADELCVVAIAAQGFLSAQRDEIEARLRKFPDFKMRLLLVDPLSQFAIDNDRMTGNAHGYNQNLVNMSLATLNGINGRTGNQDNPFYQVREFSTEFRNSIILCRRREREKEIIQAWVTLTMPAVRGDSLIVPRQSPTLELDAEKSKVSCGHFNMLWSDCDPETLQTAAAASNA